jgi:hypothetical protein
MEGEFFPSPRDFSARARTTLVEVNALFLHRHHNLGMDPVARRCAAALVRAGSASVLKAAARCLAFVSTSAGA